ncbi:hypothetical protein ACFV2H_37670 [Streptomyces sp. NPDC059629]|uniref:hypothetical protein n=1 Tax=Streptomyces sp. NPDC059629 TaxID=3346889 RepID=UPI0036AB8630
MRTAPDTTGVDSATPDADADADAGISTAERIASNVSVPAASRGAAENASVRRSKTITVPIRIMAAVVGVTLIAVSFVTVFLLHTQPAPHPKKVATFQVGKRDMPLFWPVPRAAEH